VKGNNHASDYLDIQSLIEPETIRIRQWCGLGLQGGNSWTSFRSIVTSQWFETTDVLSNKWHGSEQVSVSEQIASEKTNFR
jgi:hypothetical protein